MEPIKTTRAGGGVPRRVDAFCHFAPPALLDYLEAKTGRPHPFRGLFKARAILTDSRKRIAFMDARKLDVSVLVPLPWIEVTPTVWRNAGQAAEAARICNDALAQVVRADPARFYGVALIPTTEPQAMVRELERAVKELGFVGGLIAVGPTVKRMDDPAMEVLFQQAARLEVPLWLHPSRPITYPDYADEPASKFLDWQTLGWLHDTSTAMTRIVFAGLFERYPRLKIITHHHGALIPLFANRMEMGYRSFAQDGMKFPTPIKPPYTDHFRKFYCDTATFGFEPLVLQQALDFFGPEKMLFGTDTPMDAAEGEFLSNAARSVESLRASEADKSRIFAGNFLSLIRKAS
ncbi:MAG: amidohydrolase family protein [Cytophagales bacterium]|nr:amidohydrolase family protein [Armatimonadota bacterium]